MILSGFGPPSMQGVDGDFYIDTQSNLLYGPKTGLWGVGVKMTGPVGKDGLPGAIGPQGAAGPQGMQGFTGERGPKGFDEQIKAEDEELLKLVEFMTEQGII